VARHRDGREFPVEAIAIAERDNEGVPVVFAFVRDISERLSVEAALRRARDTAERNAEARSRFVAVVSHEMRTPLHGLTAALDLMARGRLSREQRRFLSIAQGCTQTALNQVEDLLDLTRREGDAGGEPEVVFDPATVCVALVEQSRPLARARGNRISLVVPEAPLGDVLGLRRAFERALGNLLSNAIKFTEGGEIAVRLSRLPGMRDMPEGAVRLRVEVEDQGIGIAAEHQSRIFDDFETLDDGLTRRAGGSGLGLGIARRAVRAMGGEIKLSSAPGRGSLFRFTIPMLPVPHGIAADPRQGDRASAPLCVLLVEDNPVNRTLMVESLQRLGHSAEIALDGRQGVAMAELRAFDLIVMDIGMPEIDGLTASRMIRDGAGLSRRAPILAITAHALPQHSAELRAAGITRLLTKPVRLDAFGAAIADLVLPPDDPLLDRAVLADTRSILGGPAHDRLMAQFASEVAAILGDLAQRRPEPADVAAAAHRLAGSAAVMGALRLRRLLIAVETAAQGGPGPLTERIDLAAATLALTMAAMQAEAAALSDSAEQATPAAGVPAA
jgi:signal transduction histidine kinase/DNA-binding NarL/FixJ family response regulator